MQTQNLVIFGGETYVGQEVARLGRAIGHQIMVVCQDEPPAPVHPWMAGVHWLRDDSGPKPAWQNDGPIDALIYCATTYFDDRSGRLQARNVAGVRRVLQMMESLQARLVYRSAAPTPLVPSSYLPSTRQAEALLAREAPDHVSLRLPVIYGPDRPDSVMAAAIAGIAHRFNPGAFALPMRVETAAIALLRAALEPEHQGVLTAPECAQLGDALFAQMS
ncbi:hypothetical protein DL240_09355 [Lujinxingia litoralis]|uniref:NAD-dependent epimerase/dehydratase domain-containing protein n=1 Tax=Lujinxingia litoralis TaxID=2211119 RepID=A0A328C7M8_9DELT|nr:hypothetical protein [Lujinxingia litoralis]RAL23082.1 hypothetical protein DL240_09355 [Lujinxingia litoralis]